MRIVPANCNAAHPNQRMDVVAAALGYFANHCSEGIAMGDVARALGISEDCLDLCFDQSRGMTPFEALTHHRLNRLFSAIADDPDVRLREHLRHCGLQQGAGTLASFEDAFGIALLPYRQICRRAAADRDFRRSHPHRRDLVLSPDRVRSGEVRGEPQASHPSRRFRLGGSRSGGGPA